MMETMVWIYWGIVAYLAMYLGFGCGATWIWKQWAMNKVGVFWKYTIDKGLSVYYPGYFSFASNYHWLYSVVYVALWPIMVPTQLTMMTKVLNKLTSREYWY